MIQKQATYCLHCVSKKFPLLNSLLHCQISIDFRNVCTAVNLTRQYPSHLGHIATLHWEIENSNFCRYSTDMEENANKLHL